MPLGDRKRTRTYRPRGNRMDVESVGIPTCSMGKADFLREESDAVSLWSDDHEVENYKVFSTDGRKQISETEAFTETASSRCNHSLMLILGHGLLTSDSARSNKWNPLATLECMRGKSGSVVMMNACLASNVVQQESVLEEFDGTVNRICDGIAYVSLRSAIGEELIGEYDASELAKAGISDRFKCQTIQTSVGVVVRFTEQPRRKLTAAEEAEIDHQVEEIMSGGVFDGCP